MTASPESALDGQNESAEILGGTLISGTNWLGDSIMSAPAIRMLKRRDPSCRVTLLVKPGMRPLWEMHPDVDTIIELNGGLLGAVAAARAARDGAFERAFVFPHSFRSALVPFLGSVGDRIGMPGHSRDWMLTRVVTPSLHEGRMHQAFEYLDVVGAGEITEPPAPGFIVPAPVMSATRERLKTKLGDVGDAPLVAITPGAAFGQEKRWPRRSFQEVGRALTRDLDARIVVLGSEAERDIAAAVATGIGDNAINLCGETTLAELAAVLSQCAVAICNDSGGAHLAAAVGIRAVVLYGITDPTRTCPLGSGHELIIAEGIDHSRDIERGTAAGMQAMRSILVKTVHEAAMRILQDHR